MHKNSVFLKDKTQIVWKSLHLPPLSPLCIWMCETVTCSLKQKQCLRHERQRLRDINISVRCVEKERERRSEKHESSNGGGPMLFWGISMTDGKSKALCVGVCVCAIPPSSPLSHSHHCMYHLCHLSSNQEFKSMTLSKTIIATP